MSISPSRPMPNSGVRISCGIGRADRGDRPGRLQAGLQEADAAVIFDAVERHGLPAAGRARRKMPAANWPWKARLWTVITDRHADAPGRSADRPASAPPASHGHGRGRAGSRRSRRRRCRRRRWHSAAKRRQLSGQSAPVGVAIGAAGAVEEMRRVEHEQVEPGDLGRAAARAWPPLQARHTVQHAAASAELPSSPPDSRAPACASSTPCRPAPAAARRRRRPGRRS